jgi:hypothetical protein
MAHEPGQRLLEILDAFGLAEGGLHQSRADWLNILWSDCSVLGLQPRLVCVVSRQLWIGCQRRNPGVDRSTSREFTSASWQVGLAGVGRFAQLHATGLSRMPGADLSARADVKPGLLAGSLRSPGFATTRLPLPSPAPMTTLIPILLLPGWLNSGPDHWQSRWQQLRPTLQRVDFGRWEDPDPLAWTQALRRTVETAAAPPLLGACRA